ncbi:hypothetical protein [Actinokineospora bangkokensis]|uniref:DUF4175 domain-containing protein n=1 Tax=Actinokineospora bangkokensis TaxID=1193682 RepID=A0A1Q9LC08_9PSEU|nr:hypothetical protein [Actinokineospora bangkokensis]OLR89553.1 hypothetical protein BJP25_05610 [Actinokineospora bangkokensis]
MSEGNPLKRGLWLVLRGYVLLMAIIFSLLWAIESLGPYLPWIGGLIALGTVTWIAIAVIRWRRSRW